MPTKTLTELYKDRTNSDLRNRVEVATDAWIVAQATREEQDAEKLAKYVALGYDMMVDPESASRRLMRMVPIAADAQDLDLAQDGVLAALVSQLLDIYALTRPATS